MTRPTTPPTMPAEVLAQKRHLDWLLAELERECREYLELIALVRSLPEGSDEHDTAEGDVFAQVTQLGSTIEQLEEANDAYLDALG